MNKIYVVIRNLCDEDDDTTLMCWFRDYEKAQEFIQTQLRSDLDYKYQIEPVEQGKELPPPFLSLII
jgi:hypothetical protein